MQAASFRVRAAEAADIPELMRLKHLLAQGEDSVHAVRASAAVWLRDGFGPGAGFTAFVADDGETIDGKTIAGKTIAGKTLAGMATCSRRIVTGWNGPVVFLQDLFVEAAFRRHGLARALMARVAAHARNIGSPIVELTVRADNPAQDFYRRSGFQPLPECLTYVLGGSALAELAAHDEATLTPAE
jgi:ribosomal protein S18 acetylase RimI-like enzyme